MESSQRAAGKRPPTVPAFHFLPLEAHSTRSLNHRNLHPILRFDIQLPAMGSKAVTAPLEATPDEVHKIPRSYRSLHAGAGAGLVTDGHNGDARNHLRP